jgi:hypothetical protein
MKELVKNVHQELSLLLLDLLLVLIVNVVVNPILITLNVLYANLDSSLMMVNANHAQRINTHLLMELVHVRLAAQVLKSIAIKLNVNFVNLDTTPETNQFVNDAHQEHIHLTLEPLLALNVVVDQKLIPIALLVYFVKQVYSVLMMANVNYVQKTKYLIQSEAADAILVEPVLNQMKIKQHVINAQLVNLLLQMELVNYVL